MRFARLVAPAVFTLALAVGASSASADPAVWRIHGVAGTEVTLFGSVHLLSDKTDWFTPALAADLARADQVWFEIPLDASAQGQVMTSVKATGFLPPDRTLSAMLSPSARVRLAETAKALDLPLTALERMRPWLAETQISVAYFQKAGASDDLGVEQEIKRAAPSTAKRGAMESIADQMDALAGGDDREQVASLEKTLKDIKDDPQSFQRLVRAWASGDTKGLVREELDPMRRESPGLYRRLVVERNRRWVGELETLLKDPSAGRVLVVVGVGHLVGPESVPALLARDGVKVEGP